MEPVIAARESARTPSRSKRTTPSSAPATGSPTSGAAPRYERQQLAVTRAVRRPSPARVERRDEPVHEPVAVGHDVEALGLAGDVQDGLAAARAGAHVDRPQLERAGLLARDEQPAG